LDLTKLYCKYVCKRQKIYKIWRGTRVYIVSTYVSTTMYPSVQLLDANENVPVYYT
jgi:hypothetical protein